MSNTRTTLLAGAALALLAPLLATATAGAATTATAGGTTTVSPAVDSNRSAADDLLAESTSSRQTRSGRDRVLSRVSHDGHTLTFVEHRAIGTIGVYESLPLGVTPYLTAMRDETASGSGPTALELYRSLTSRAAPPALVADHQRQSGAGVGSVVLPPAHGADPTDGSCSYNEAFAYGSQWAWNWHNGIGQQHDLHAQLSFFDHVNGNVGRRFDANRSSARWLAACNGSHPHGFPEIYLRPESLVDGVWTGHHREHVEPFTQEIYWSAGGPERWRLHMTESVDFNVEILRNWAIGGAVDKPFGLVSGG